MRRALRKDKKTPFRVSRKGGNFAASKRKDVHFDLCGHVFHQADLRVHRAGRFDRIHFNAFFVDVEALFGEGGGDLRGSHASEHLAVFAHLDADVRRSAVESGGEFFGRFQLLRFVEALRRLALGHFVDAARRRDLRKSAFQKKILGEAVGNFDDVALFPAALYVRFENYFHVLCPPFRRLHLYFTGFFRKCQ